MRSYTFDSLLTQRVYTILISWDSKKLSLDQSKLGNRWSQFAVLVMWTYLKYKLKTDYQMPAINDKYLLMCIKQFQNYYKFLLKKVPSSFRKLTTSLIPLNLMVILRNPIHSPYSFNSRLRSKIIFSLSYKEKLRQSHKHIGLISDYNFPWKCLTKPWEAIWVPTEKNWITEPIWNVSNINIFWNSVS